ncbi:unnamed protein product [Cuscuta campestris]|uniref:Uncharacterized protein n=1 Tax=Cuscuta campestris TaxID=132261 RepID=A0A484MT82_9ASTE|nr:unnamed protein product [Cuscuta campestris]
MPRLVIDKIDHTSSLMCSPSPSFSSSSSSSKPSPNDPLPKLTPNHESSGTHEMAKPENSKQENACNTCVATGYESRSVFEEDGFGHLATSAFDASMLECQLAFDDWFGAEVADSFWSIDESRQAAEEEVGGEWVLS